MESLSNALTPLISALLALSSTLGAGIMPATQNAAVSAAIPTITTHDLANSDPLSAVVNLYCTVKTKKTIRTITGSGIVIDPRGIILTNAHIGQFLLLGDDKKITSRCVVRNGSPAVARYVANLLYIPPQWVYENAKELVSTNPTGTGRNDFSLLYITEATRDTLPTSFPYLHTTITPLTAAEKNSTVYVAGYPAEDLKHLDVKNRLKSVIATTTITNVYSFEKNTVDLIGVAGSDANEQGVSGGPILTKDNSIVALITTKGSPKKDGEHSLRAITLSYIDRVLKTDTGFGLSATLEGDLNRKAAVFKEALTPFLKEIITDILADK